MIVGKAETLKKLTEKYGNITIIELMEILREEAMKHFEIILEEQFGEHHSFYMLNCTRYINGKTYHLLESEVYGEDLQVIVDENMDYIKIACDGLSDLDYYFEED